MRKLIPVLVKNVFRTLNINNKIFFIFSLVEDLIEDFVFILKHDPTNTMNRKDMEISRHSS
jgi:hypothetical protein